MRGPASRRGYSLIEVMMVVTIVGILGSVGGLIFTQLESFYVTVNARTIIQRDDRASLDIMDRFLRQAQKATVCIDSPGSSPACSCMGGLGTSGGYWSRICFSTIDGRNLRFFQNGTTLSMALQPSSGGSYDSSTLSKNVCYLAFSFSNTNDPSIISVALASSQAVQLSRQDVLEMSIQKVRIMN
jgi:prepilin-type N-terminal cleavage/methylation domain-containing protein